VGELLEADHDRPAGVARGLINSVVTQLEYDGLLDVMITGCAGSADLYADEARRVMAMTRTIRSG
jgi:hypothetical protein